MRDRPFVSAGESPRPYSAIREERGALDPRRPVLARIAELEGESRAAEDADERKRLQCEAEALRCWLEEQQPRK